MAGITSLNASLTILMVLYFLAFLAAVLAGIPMIVHVSPKSECLLFSFQVTPNGKLSYGNYASKYAVILYSMDHVKSEVY